jgi:hypothetical protein
MMGPEAKRDKQVHRNAEQWQKLVEAWRASGMTRHAWCDEHDIAYESLRRWSKRLRSAPVDAQFVEIDLQSQKLDSSRGAWAKVHRDGEVELYGEPSEELLRTVLTVIREAADVH